MPEYSDIYVISKKRDKEILFEFLDEFIPVRVESCDEYFIPQYSDQPKHVYRKADKVIDWCVANLDEDYGIYWRNDLGGKPEHAMVFYLKDGYVIYGLSTDASYREYAQELLLKVKEFLGAERGYIAHEAAPNCDNHEEFIHECELYGP